MNKQAHSPGGSRSQLTSMPAKCLMVDMAFPDHALVWAESSGIHHSRGSQGCLAHLSNVPQHKNLSFDVPEQLNEIGYEQDEQTDLLCDSLADMSLDNRHLVQEMISIFPDVANNLDASGKRHDWGKSL